METVESALAVTVRALDRARNFIANDTTSDPEMVAAELKNIDDALATARAVAAN